MAAKKSTPARKRGRPRKSTSAPASSSSSAAAPASSSSSAPASSSSSSVDQLIAGATSTPAPNADAAREALAASVESETPPRSGVVLTGEIHGPGASSASSADVAQLSQQIAALAVVLFGVLALWRGDEWALEEDEAELLGEATAEPYAEEAAELMQKVKWLGPVTALLGIAGRKFMAETDRKKKEPPPRAPGTAPAGQ